MNTFLLWLPVLSLVGLVLTAILLTLTTGWRASFAALGAQYLFAAALLAQVVIWQIAATLGAVGVLVVLILVFAGRQVNFARAASAVPAQPAGYFRQRFAALRRIEFQTNLPFRVVAVMLALVATWYGVTEAQLVVPGLPVTVNLAGDVLIALGLLNLGLTEEPMNAGMGLLMMLTGVTLLYAPVEPARTVVVLLAGLNLGVALAVSYLAYLRYGGVTAAPAQAPAAAPEAEAPLGEGEVDEAG